MGKLKNASPFFLVQHFINTYKKKEKIEMNANDPWEMIHHILEAMGLFFIPFVGWTLMTIISHSKQIIMLESKVNDSLDRRLLSLEHKVVNLEEKIDRKIDSIESNVIDCKLSINNLITEKFENLMTLVNEKKNDK